MSNFDFTDEQAEFEATVRDLAKAEFHDGYLARATSDEMPWDVLKRLGELHLLDLAYPEEHGGQAVDPVTLGIAVEQVARADFNASYLVFGAPLAAGCLAARDPAIGLRSAEAVMTGAEVCAGAITEPKGGSDAAHPGVRAIRDGDGWRLRGEKTSVTLGSHAAEAIVLATVDPSLGSKGTARFLVDLTDPSVGRQQFQDPGFRPLGRAALAFDDTYVEAGRELLPDAVATGSGAAQMLHTFDLTRSLLGLMVIGAARRAMDATIEWVSMREAFGRPIAGYQGVSFTLAEHDTMLEAARWLCYRSLALRAAGKVHSREAAMVKWWAPQVAVAAINACIVLHGHVGWSMEMPLMQLLLDVSGVQIGDGTPQIQKLVIARQLLGRELVG